MRTRRCGVADAVTSLRPALATVSVVVRASGPNGAPTAVGESDAGRSGGAPKSVGASSRQPSTSSSASAAAIDSTVNRRHDIACSVSGRVSRAFRGDAKAIGGG
jgi:hypothetical protein